MNKLINYFKWYMWRLKEWDNDIGDRGLKPGVSDLVCFEIKYRFLSHIKKYLKDFHWSKKYIFPRSRKKELTLFKKLKMQIFLFRDILRCCCRDISFVLLTMIALPGLYDTFGCVLTGFCAIFMFAVKWKDICKTLYVWEKPVLLSHIQYVVENSEKNSDIHRIFKKYEEINFERLKKGELRDCSIFDKRRNELLKNMDTYKNWWVEESGLRIGKDLGKKWNQGYKENGNSSPYKNPVKVECIRRVGR